MRRREFIALFGAVIRWLLAGHGQQSPKIPRIGVLMSSQGETHPFVGGCQVTSAPSV